MLETTNKTKVNVRMWPQVTQALHRDLRDIPVRRDGFLNALLTREIERLAEEVHFRTPDEARARIKSLFRELKPEPLTIVLDRTLVARIDQVLRERNISRNAFINRVLFFLVAKPQHLKLLDLAFDWRVETLVKPLEEIWSNLTDPFFNLRSANGEKFYSLFIQEERIAADWPSLFGLNCAINPDDWQFFNSPFPNHLFDLGEEEVQGS
jgi:hypothetical protein